MQLYFDWLLFELDYLISWPSHSSSKIRFLDDFATM